MTSDSIGTRAALSRSNASAAAFASLFVVLATISPTTTFHLGPVLVSASGAVAAGRGHGPVPGLISFSVSLVAVLLLDQLDFLMGPSLLPVGGALLESLVGAVVGFLVAPVFLYGLELVQGSETDQA